MMLCRRAVGKPHVLNNNVSGPRSVIAGQLCDLREVYGVPAPLSLLVLLKPGGPTPICDFASHARSCIVLPDQHGGPMNRRLL
jgi:hypothetical protein